MLKKRFKYWRRLFGNQLNDCNKKQEVIALLGIFKVKTPKELSDQYNFCLAYVYKLIKSAKELCDFSPETIGAMLNDHNHGELLAAIFEKSPEAAAYFIDKFNQSERQKTVGCERENVEVNDEALEKDKVLRFILTLALEYRASAENIKVSLELVLGYSTSTTAIEGILKKYEEMARKEGEKIDMLVLPKIVAVALDEIYQHETPIFTVVDLNSTYAILIKPKDDRKGETWGEELEQLKKLGLKPEEFVSDACGSILMAVPQSFEEAIVIIDVFHILKGLNDVVCQAIRYLEMPRTEAEGIWARYLKGTNLQARTWKKLEELEEKAKENESKIEDIRILRKWIIELVDFSGYTYEESLEELKWCLAELNQVIGRRGRKGKTQTLTVKEDKDDEDHRTKLEKAIDGFLDQMPKSLKKYLELLDTHLKARAEETGIPFERLKTAYRLCRFKEFSCSYDDAKRKACIQYRCDWQVMSEAEQTVKEVIAKTPRSSSLVENLNSRLRPVLTKKKTLTVGYLNLLRLYLNTRPYQRSRKDERKGKSPYEIVTGDTVNFFEILGIAPAKPSVCVA